MDSNAHTIFHRDTDSCAHIYACAVFDAFLDDHADFSATITYIASTIIHQEDACNWQGIGGTVVDASNTDMLRMTIRLAGRYSGKSKTELTVSSIAPAYGKSGYEFFLGTVPIASKGELNLQLLDQAGLPLSDVISIDTYSNQH